MIRKLTIAAALFATTSMLALTAQAAETAPRMTTIGVEVVESGVYHTTSDNNEATEADVLRSNSNGVRHMWNDDNNKGENAPHPLFIDMQTYRTVAKQIAAPAPRVEAPAGNPYATTVLFDFDRSTLTGTGTAQLDTLISRLHSEGLTRVNVQGHTDSSGSNAYNQTLSHERATAVANYMIQKGIGAEVGTVTWDGETNQAVRTADGVRLHENRRVEVQAL
ncbi:MAG: OmpA family protein [Rhodovibrionaceae bacterium]